MAKKVELIVPNWRELECQNVSVKIKGRRRIGTIYSESFLSDFWCERWIFRPRSNDITLYETCDRGIDGCERARKEIVEKYQITKA